jgi:hypothetical protein
MSDQVVYLDRFQIREGKLDDFKRYAEGYSEFVEKNEPGVISFNFYIEDGGTAARRFSYSPTRKLWTFT